MLPWFLYCIRGSPRSDVFNYLCKPAATFRHLRGVAEGPIVFYYRVAETRTRQVKSTEIKEVREFLKRLRLSFACGQPYKDDFRSGLRVPVAINKSKWHLYVAKNEKQRKKLIARMEALGIEAIADKPDEDDDD